MHCAAARARTADKPAGASVTVLVVEDERFVRDVTCETLRQAGYRVVHAECARAARKVFLRYRKQIQLLLCDAVLPDSSGILLAQTLQQLSPRLKVIVASGYPGAGLRPGASDMESANEFLAKPYGAASLISRVRSGLRREEAPEPVQVR